MSSRLIAALGLALAIAGTFGTHQLDAQTPVAATSTLSGTVHDATGAALADVTITLVGEPLSTRADSIGRFTLRDVPAGRHTALVRRIGFQSVEYRWTAQSGRALQVDVAMMPVTRQLDRVVVEAPGNSRRRGTSSIGGSVRDSTGAPVPNADVRLLGAGLSTITDSSGSFQFESLAAGSYMVRIRRHGLRPITHVMQIVDDDNRSIAFKMFGLPRGSNASGYGSADAPFDAFDHRMLGESGRPLLGPGDLFRYDRASLEFVLQQYRDPAFNISRRSAEQGTGSTDDGDCLLLDGRRAVYQPLRSFSANDVQLVEVFRPNAFVDETMVSQMDLLRECRGSAMHHPAYFVLWTRSVH